MRRDDAFMLDVLIAARKILAFRDGLKVVENIRFAEFME